ncbi:ABC transporter ATP-binding protein [Candidatus Sumerlaeota bacterium]
MATDNVIEVRNLTVDYKSRSGKVCAVDDISFAVRAGECLGFIGPNGAGKSSSIKALMGFVYPSGGQVRVFGQPAGVVESKLRIGYLPEVALYYPFLSGVELLKLYGGLHRVPRATLRERIPRLLEVVGLANDGHRRIQDYSKGMQQRLGIAQALIAEPECLIFDELSSGLDPVGRYDLRNVLLDLKERGVTIFFSSHELYEVEALCDRVVAINNGRILFDRSLEDLLEASKGQGLEKHFISLVRQQDEDLAERRAVSS